jgi:hypothetical protein
MKRKPPRPLTRADLGSRPRIVTAIDSAPMIRPRLSAEWMLGPDDMAPRVMCSSSHVLLWCAPHIITTTGEPTTLLVRNDERVVPSDRPCADIIPWSAELWQQSLPASRLQVMAFCFVPLICATQREEDRPYVVRMKKLGVTRLMAVEAGAS